MRERWRPVVGYEGLYEVSNLGRVRRVKVITPTRKKHGYMQISLVDRNGVRKSFRLHRIVATAFVPNPEDKPHGSKTPVVQIDPATLKVLAEYPGQTAASKATGIRVSCINACLRGEQKRAGGYLWAYKYKKVVL